MSAIDEEAYIVDSLAVVQKGKLRANGHKPHWLDMTLEQLLDGLKAEVAELEVAARLWRDGHLKPARVRDECADVSNQCAMLAAFVAPDSERRGGYGRLPSFAETRLASKDTP